ncbi:CU044_2847 family protein [Streptomyces sp. NBC_01451]|uniref:CU044_2847 family protein n=1 Tax=Streptomyces sp. NBC_01451 TaxID=2903872 RepID=UPI002E32576B|nr:CU044_2847 family protein [Streptomyces sp. NBC_01451]
MAGQAVLVQAGTTELYMEVARGGGPQTVGVSQAMAFDGVRECVEAVAAQLAQAWDHVKPTEATVEFGLSVTVKSGKLTGLIVEGGGAASLNITLTWRPSEPGHG